MFALPFLSIRVGGAIFLNFLELFKSRLARRYFAYRYLEHVTFFLSSRVFIKKIIVFELEIFFITFRGSVTLHRIYLLYSYQ